jgi:hypothetical protein
LLKYLANHHFLTIFVVLEIIQLFPFQLKSDKIQLDARVSISQYHINDESYCHNKLTLFSADSLPQLHVKELLFEN